MKEFKGDKRTKEYKIWKEAFDKRPKGLGDTVAKVTKFTGIDKVAKAFNDCGCDDRQESLNKLFPNSTVNCFTESEYEYLSDIFKNRRLNLNRPTINKMKDIYERVFEKKLIGCSTCSFRKRIYNPLHKLYSTYNKKNK